MLFNSEEKKRLAYDALGPAAKRVGLIHDVKDTDRHKTTASAAMFSQLLNFFVVVNKRQHEWTE